METFQKGQKTSEVNKLEEAEKNRKEENDAQDEAPVVESYSGTHP